jgi:hypothetical protein
MISNTFIPNYSTIFTPKSHSGQSLTKIVNKAQKEAVAQKHKF